MATLHRGTEGHIIYKKGAVERVLGRCSTMLGHDGSEVPIDREKIRATAEAMAARGLARSRFCTAKRHKRTNANLIIEHVARDLTFLGLQRECWIRRGRKRSRPCSTVKTPALP